MFVQFVFNIYSMQQLASILTMSGQVSSLLLSDLCMIALALSVED